MLLKNYRVHQGSRKKKLFFSGQTTKSDLGLVVIRNFFSTATNKEKCKKKTFLFPQWSGPNPPPLLVVGPLKKEFFLRLPLYNLGQVDFPLFWKIICCTSDSIVVSHYRQLLVLSIFDLMNFALGGLRLKFFNPRSKIKKKKKFQIQSYYTSKDVPRITEFIPEKIIEKY